MKDVVGFVTENYATIIFIGFLIVNLINAITDHFESLTGLKKVGLVLAQFLSFVVSKDEPGKFKFPGVLSKSEPKKVVVVNPKEDKND